MHLPVRQAVGIIKSGGFGSKGIRKGSVVVAVSFSHGDFFLVRGDVITYNDIRYLKKRVLSWTQVTRRALRK